MILKSDGRPYPELPPKLPDTIVVFTKSMHKRAELPPPPDSGEYMKKESERQQANRIYWNAFWLSVREVLAERWDALRRLFI